VRGVGKEGGKGIDLFKAEQLGPTSSRKVLHRVSGSMVRRHVTWTFYKLSAYMIHTPDSDERGVASG
jgi:hypothetical protein